MRFPRSARLFTGQLDAAPFAAVLFLLVMFLTLGGLVYTPGVPLRLPAAGELPGIDEPTVAVAIDGNGRLYFENQWIQEGLLVERLRQAASTAPRPPVLVVQADAMVSYEALIRLTMMAREAGITNAFLATLPNQAAPAPPTQKP